jgi:serine/threonine-protein kinase RsbW
MVIDAEAWDFGATREAPGLARHAVSDYAVNCGAHEDIVAPLALCVTEAVTNAVLHAYREADAPGRIRVRAECGDERIRVTVRDEGMGLAPRLDSPGLGLGLPLIAQMAHASEVRVPEDGGTEVCIRFNIAEGGGLGRAASRASSSTDAQPVADAAW